MRATAALGRLLRGGRAASVVAHEYENVNRERSPLAASRRLLASPAPAIRSTLSSNHGRAPGSRSSASPSDWFALRN